MFKDMFCVFHIYELTIAIICIGVIDILIKLRTKMKMYASEYSSVSVIQSDCETVNFRRNNDCAYHLKIIHEETRYGTFCIIVWVIIMINDHRPHHMPQNMCFTTSALQQVVFNTCYTACSSDSQRSRETLYLCFFFFT